MRDKAILAGPFIGDITWEIYRFAPFILYLKDTIPDAHLVVFTRPESFDLYGVRASILVPLKLPHEKTRCFSCDLISDSKYASLVETFKVSYKGRFKVVSHVFPVLRGFYWRVKWQFPRLLYNYDFRPRSGSRNAVERIQCDFFVSTFCDIQNLLTLSSRYTIITTSDLRNSIQETINCTYIGCVIEILKKSKCFIGDISSSEGQLALLLKVPVITTENLSSDEVSLLNPLRTPVIFCNDILTGVEIYENNF